MADLIDMAGGIEAEHVARGLARIDAAIPAGVAGECDDCGEVMPRLVGGRCGFCRDGRRHPFERTPQPATGAPARVPPPAPVKETTMPNPTGTRTVGFAASGTVLRAIEARVAAGESTSAVVKALVEAGLSRMDDAAERQVEQAQKLLLDLSAVSDGDLLDELRDRIDRAGRTADLLARAVAAEAKVAAMAAVLAPVGAAS